MRPVIRSGVVKSGAALMRILLGGDRTLSQHDPCTHLVEREEMRRLLSGSLMAASVPRMVLPSIAIWALRSAPPWVAKRLGSSPHRRLVSARVRRGSHDSGHFSPTQPLHDLVIGSGGRPPR